MPPHAAGVEPPGQWAISELGDVHMAQFIQGHVAKLIHKQCLSLVSHGLELAAVCGRVFSRVDAIRIRKHELGLPLLPSEIQGNQL